MTKIITEASSLSPERIEALAERMAADQSGAVAKIEDIPALAELEGHEGHLVMLPPATRTSIDFRCSCGTGISLCWEAGSGEVDLGPLGYKLSIPG